MISDVERYEDYVEQLHNVDQAIRKATVCIKELRTSNDVDAQREELLKHRYDLGEFRALYTRGALLIAEKIAHEQGLRVDRRPITTCSLVPYTKQTSRYDAMNERKAQNVRQRMIYYKENMPIWLVDRLFESIALETPQVEILAGEKGL